MHRPRKRSAILVGLALTASLAPLGLTSPAAAVSPDVVISQVYGGGGNAGAPLRSDFVELFNTGSTPVDVTGWTVQYASATGAYAPTNTGQTTTLTGTIAPGAYYLVKQADGANTAAAALPAPDATGTTAMSGTGAKVRLVTGTSEVRDLVAYGAGTPGEGASTPALSNTTAAQRVASCVDTDSNAADFAVVAPAPRNAATPAAPCTTTPPGDAALVVTNPSPVTQSQGTAATYVVSASDTDDAVTATVGATPAGVTATTTGSGTGTATVTVEVAGTVPAGELTVPITFSTPEQTVDSPLVVTVQVVDQCGTPATQQIAQVQGSGAASPLVGQPVRVEGVVVGDFQATGQFGGFYVQDDTPDADPLTSDGIRVFNSASPVAVGDRVRVSGTVEEFTSSSALYTGSETQLGSSSTVTVCGTAPVPAPTDVTLPFAETVGGVSGQERYEGTLARLAQTDLVATDLFTLGRFGEVSLTTGELLTIPTTAEQDAANNRDRITLDDGLSGQNLPVLPYTVGGDGVTLPRAGDTLSEPATGVLTYAFGEWRLEPAVGTTLDFARTNPREPAPQDVGGDVQVASFNVLNYFVGFGGDNRGADDAAELERQQAKLVAAITGLDADVVGLIEIANDDGAALDRLVAALNAAQPDAADDYVAVQAPDITPATSLGGTYGTDAIRQAIVYRPAVVSPTGPAPSDPALLNPADPLFPAEPVFDRPPAVQEFVPVGGDREFTVVVNHFKSKGSTNAQCGPPDAFGGNCDDLRERQSTALLGLVEDLGAEDVALLGDFNSYEEEAPISLIEAGGFTSVVADQPREDRSSYSFDGEFGSLDYVFLSESLLPARTGADIWQVNSPEAVALDYNSFNQPQLYAPDAFASSDHDPVLVGLELVEDVVLGCDVVASGGGRLRLQADCTVAEALVVPAQATFDGGGFTVTAVDPQGGVFTGPVVRVGARAVVRDLVVDGSALTGAGVRGLEAGDRADLTLLTVRGFVGSGDGVGVAFTAERGALSRTTLRDNACGLQLTQGSRVTEQRVVFTGNTFAACSTRP